MSTPEPMFAVNGLSVVLPSRHGAGGIVRAVNDVSFDLAEGETFGIVGESGAGKSVLLRTLAGLYRPSAGSFHFRGEEIGAARGRRLKEYRRQVQIVLQNPYSSLPPRRAVVDILAEPLDIHGVARGTARAARIQSTLEGVGLARAFLSRTPEQLSGGQRQRVAIARALVLEPKLLLLDEPVSALDVSIRAQVLNLLSDLRGARRLSYVVVSHDLSTLRALAERVGVMFQGRLVETAPVAELVAAPRHEYTRRLLAAVPSVAKSLARRAEDAARRTMGDAHV